MNGILVLTGCKWTARISIYQAFPTTKQWMRNFHKQAVLQSDSDPVEVWEQIKLFLISDWKSANNDAIRKAKLDIENEEKNLSIGNKEDQKVAKKHIRKLKSHIKKMRQAETKIKGNIDFIEQAFIERK